MTEPLKTSPVLFVRMPAELYSRLILMAARDDRSVSSYVRRLIAEHVKGEA